MLGSIVSSQHKSSSAEATSFSGGVPAAVPAPSSAAPAPLSNIAPNPPSAPTPAPVPAPAPAPPSTNPFPPTKLVIKQGGGGASVSWSSSCPAAATSRLAERNSQSSSFSRASTASSSFSSSSFKSSAADDDDALPQRTNKPPLKTYEARRRIGLKLKIKQDQTGFSKVVHNTALDPVHTPQPQQSSQSIPHTKTQPQFEAAVPNPKSQPLSTPPSTVIRTQPPVSTASSASSLATTTTQCNPPLRGSVAPIVAPSSSTSSSHTWSSSTSSSTQMNGTLDHDNVSRVKHNSASTVTPSQTTCRLPLRKTYRENISPRVRPGVPGGGDESLSYPRPTPSPPRQEASPSPPSERTVIASVKVEKRGREASHTHAESSHETGRLGSAMQGLDEMDEVFNRGIKTAHHHRVPQLLDREGAKERGEELMDSDVSKYKMVKHRHRAGGTFRMDPGPPSPESSFTRDSLLPAKRCKSDSPDMDNASFSSGSPPDDTLDEHLQCAIDSILNLQQEPSARGHHIKGGNSRSHQSQRPGGSAASSHRPSVPPSSSASSSSSLAQHPQVGGRGHNGSLVPQTQSR